MSRRRASPPPFVADPERARLPWWDAIWERLSLAEREAFVGAVGEQRRSPRGKARELLALVKHGLLTRRGSELVASPDARAFALRIARLSEAPVLFEPTVDDLADTVWVAATPSLLGARILVIDAAADADRDQLAAVLNAPVVDDVAVVAVWSGARVPKAIAGIDGIVHLTGAAPRNKGDRSSFVAEQLRAAGLTLDPRSTAELTERLGENPERIWSTIEALSAYADADGNVERVALDAVSTGGSPPWLLSDAIESGNAGAAIRAVHTLMNHSGWVPLQILGYLRKRYTAVWRVAVGAAPQGGFVGKQHTRVATRWGATGAEAVLGHIDAADGALKGASACDATGVLEVLVARTARTKR